MKKVKSVSLCAVLFVLMTTIGVAAVVHVSIEQDACFVSEFNQSVPVYLQKESVKEIKQVLPECYTSMLGAEDWAYLWVFCDKYDIDRLPTPNTEWHYEFAREIVAHCKAVDEKVMCGELGAAHVSASLNQAFAVSRLDFVSIAQQET